MLVTALSFFFFVILSLFLYRETLSKHRLHIDDGNGKFGHEKNVSIFQIQSRPKSKMIKGGAAIEKEMIQEEARCEHVQHAIIDHVIAAITKNKIIEEEMKSTTDLYSKAKYSIKLGNRQKFQIAEECLQVYADFLMRIDRFKKTLHDINSLVVDYQQNLKKLQDCTDESIMRHFDFEDEILKILQDVVFEHESSIDQIEGMRNQFNSLYKQMGLPSDTDMLSSAHKDINFPFQKIKH